MMVFLAVVVAFPAVGVNSNTVTAAKKTAKRSKGIIPQAWGPLAEGKHGIFTDSKLAAIGKKYGKSTAQIALRWNVQRGVSILPKTVHVERMEQNIDIWDFELTGDEMQAISEKDLGHSEIINHFDPQLVKMLNGMKIH